MPDAKKLGLHLTVAGGNPAERIKFAREAEDLGYTSLWMGEVSGPDVLVTLGARRQHFEGRARAGRTTDPDSHAGRECDGVSHHS
jgi:alkanesulfonate monooxygenase SsuD/methylene tetrahydromethanopterin reductase-like flavin-dependent oxidoreductase (luciferase family)